MVQIIILGCGWSLGVPVIACECKVCTSTLIYNKRTRSAIIIKNKDSQILIDFGFEIREQLVKANIKKLDAAILTHDHADHVAGIDNLKIFSNIHDKPLQIITDSNTGKEIENRYKYLFHDKHLLGKFVDFNTLLKLGSMEVQLFRQHHGLIDSIGIKVMDFVYSNDVNDFPSDSEKFLYNLQAWVLDCQSYISNSRHLGFDKILALYEKYKPKKLFLTNLGHQIDYEEISRILPKNIIALYDGYVINI